MKKFLTILYLFSLATAVNCFADAGNSSGGGGGFVWTKFWDAAENQVLPYLTAHPQPGIDLNLMKKVISKKYTTVQITDEELWSQKKGYTDALNYPKKRLIKLFKTTWIGRFEENLDVRQLILHEFLGIARIPDENPCLSCQVFPVSSHGVIFAHDALTCRVSHYVMIFPERAPPAGSPDWAGITQYSGGFDGRPQKFTSSIALHPGFEDQKSKLISYRMDLPFDKDMPGLKTPEWNIVDRYSLIVDATMTDHNMREKDPFLIYSVKLVHSTITGGQSEVVAAGETQVDMTHSNQGVQLLLPEYETLLLSLGITIPTGYGFGFGEWAAIRDAAIKVVGEHNYMDQVRKWLTPLPRVLPVTMNVVCKTIDSGSTK